MIVGAYVFGLTMGIIIGLILENFFQIIDKISNLF